MTTSLSQLLKAKLENLDTSAAVTLTLSLGGADVFLHEVTEICFCLHSEAVCFRAGLNDVVVPMNQWQTMIKIVDTSAGAYVAKVEFWEIVHTLIGAMCEFRSEVGAFNDGKNQPPRVHEDFCDILIYAQRVAAAKANLDQAEEKADAEIQAWVRKHRKTA